jgi:hypothetical protein
LDLENGCGVVLIDVCRKDGEMHEEDQQLQERTVEDA